MGHKNIAVTLNRYGYMYPKDLVNVVTKANEFIVAIRRKHNDNTGK